MPTATAAIEAMIQSGAASPNLAHGHHHAADEHGNGDGDRRQPRQRQQRVDQHDHDQVEERDRVRALPHLHEADQHQDQGARGHDPRRRGRRYPLATDRTPADDEQGAGQHVDHEDRDGHGRSHLGVEHGDQQEGGAADEQGLRGLALDHAQPVRDAARLVGHHPGAHPLGTRASCQCGRDRPTRVVRRRSDAWSPPGSLPAEHVLDQRDLALDLQQPGALALQRRLHGRQPVRTAGAPPARPARWRTPPGSRPGWRPRAGRRTVPAPPGSAGSATAAGRPARGPAASRRPSRRTRPSLPGAGHGASPSVRVGPSAATAAIGARTAGCRRGGSSPPRRECRCAPARVNSTVRPSAATASTSTHRRRDAVVERGDAVDGEHLVALQAQGVGTHARLELQRQHAHADEVERWMRS